MVMDNTVNIKLHIGCGDKYIPGFVHVDVRKLPHVDYVTTADNLEIFADGSVDLIYSCHMLEHLPRTTVPKVLAEWHRVLRPGGTLRLAVPDFEKIAEVYRETGTIKPLRGLLCGGQDYPENNHYGVFDFTHLSKILEEAGFRNVHRYNWQDTIHKDYDDFSQAYLPHMDKGNGTLMSLNVEATK
jgi:predicted SAM-dependent methyltransferase